jgi:hypothetical protein
MYRITLLRVRVTIFAVERKVLNIMSRAVFTHGPKGPWPRAANFQGRHIKKSRLKYGMRERKAVHEREI